MNLAHIIPSYPNKCALALQYDMWYKFTLSKPCKGVRPLPET